MMRASAPPTDSPVRHDYFALAGVASLVSIAALVFYYHRGGVLLYGDAVAHINIARRVFDSRTPGLFQLGTVWLPLPHLFDVPFIMNDWLWRASLGAALPLMIAFVAGRLGGFSLGGGLAFPAAGWVPALSHS